MTTIELMKKGEPTIRDALSEPIVQAMMAADNVPSHALKALLCEMRWRITGETCIGFAPGPTGQRPW